MNPLFLLLSLLAFAEAAKTTKAPTKKPLDCSNVQQQYCPPGKPAPNVVFDPQGGMLTNAVSTPCCPAKYVQCQEQIKTPICRDLGYYTIKSSTANNEEKCPATTSDCTCQQGLDSETSLQLNFCPSTTNCCPECECHGDPHCSPFDSNIPSAVWAVCDDRGPNCLHGPDTCVLTNYTGVPCRWINHGNGFSECVHGVGTPEPEMLMYTKTYKDYFNPNDPKNYVFSLNLELTYYGSIGTIRLQDAGVNATFTLVNGNCVASPKYPLNAQKKATVKGLKSGVELQFTCMSNGVGRPHRWDVTYVKDPWFIAGQAGFGGYCKSGVITEKKDMAIGGCRIMDRQVAMYFGCSSGTNLDICKQQFCAQKADMLSFPGAGTSLAKCNVFVGDVSQPDNFLKAACALSKLASHDPTTCAKIKDCQRCVDDITDYPDEIAQILAPPSFTLAPTMPATCPPNLLARGLARKKLAVINNGVQVEYLDKNTTWVSVLALLDEEISACGGCKNFIKVSGKVAGNAALLQPGRYRIRQCNGYDAGAQGIQLTKTEMCESPVGYNTSVVFSNPLSGGSVSQTYGSMYDSNQLICNQALYPNCPASYKCCIWDRKTQVFAWTQCMNANHWNPINYPSCNL